MLMRVPGDVLFGEDWNFMESGYVMNGSSFEVR